MNENDIREKVQRLLKGKVEQYTITRGVNQEYYCSVPQKEASHAIAILARDEFELTCLFCVQNFKETGLSMIHVFEKKNYAQFLILEYTISHRSPKEAESIALLFPSANWYEREITDGFGIRFPKSFDQRRLFLHESYPEEFHPLLKSFRNKKDAAKPSKKRKLQPYPFKPVEGEGVYQIGVGPVHAGIIEPGHFRFSVIGETIANLEIRMFYKHRGIEKFAEGKKPEECVALAEAISGDESIANAVGFCNAVERISGLSVPQRAICLRTIFMELERMYALLGDLAGMVIDVAYPVGASPFFMLREEIFRKNETMTGSRFLRQIICIGGVTKDVAQESLHDLMQCTKIWSEQLKDAVSAVKSLPSVTDRFESTGIIRKTLVRPLHLTGPIAKASGMFRDTRVEHPYGMYTHLPIARKILEKGDVMARFETKAVEILDSAQLIQRILMEIKSSEIKTERSIKDGCALSVVEAVRGQNMHWIQIKDGKVERYKIRTASFCNWLAIEHAVMGNIVPDFPLINKSLNLSYAGTDL
ncbi:NADH-quinone oxidoreductase subunit C [Candidatus Woesearchaeota archaeon]|nr:NADH-quinone oxidoreductase subunit C [Candidatus Woesearchaeota archaeon]